MSSFVDGGPSCVCVCTYVLVGGLFFVCLFKYILIFCRNSTMVGNIQYHHHHQSLNREGRWGTTDDFTASLLHFSLFSTALWDLVNSRPVHSLMLSSNLFFCQPCLLPLFTVPCKMIFARHDERETCTSTPLQFASLYDGQEVFMWSDCLMDLGTDLVTIINHHSVILPWKLHGGQRKDRMVMHFLSCMVENK